MSILGRGDLAPRRRQRRRGRIAAVFLLAVAVLAAAGYVGWRVWGSHGSTPTAGPRPRTCRTPTAAPAPLPAHAVRLRILNGTLRAGLAADAQHALQRRGFRIMGIGNTPRRVKHTEIDKPSSSGSPAATAAAVLALSEQVPGATIGTTSGHDVLLTIGPHWRLASPAAADRARRADERAAHPTPVCTG
jgi:hypothetical protein